MILYFFFCVDSDYLCEGFVPVCQILTDNKTAAFPESVSGLIPAEYSQDDIANFFRFQGIDRVINKKIHELLSPTVLRNNKMVYEATAFVMPKRMTPTTAPSARQRSRNLNYTSGIWRCFAGIINVVQPHVSAAHPERIDPVVICKLHFQIILPVSITSAVSFLYFNIRLLL